MSNGYAGVQNPLFLRDNSQMIFGDVRERVEDILVALPKPDRRAAAPAGQTLRWGSAMGNEDIENSGRRSRP